MTKDDCFIVAIKTIEVYATTIRKVFFFMRINNESCAPSIAILILEIL